MDVSGVLAPPRVTLFPSLSPLMSVGVCGMCPRAPPVGFLTPGPQLELLGAPLQTVCQQTFSRPGSLGSLLEALGYTYCDCSHFSFICHSLSCSFDSQALKSSISFSLAFAPFFGLTCVSFLFFLILLEV